MFNSMGVTNPQDLGNGGTLDGDVVITGDLSISGGVSLTLSEVLEGTSTIDITNTEAFLIRRNGDGGDIFTVDTTNAKIIASHNDNISIVIKSTEATRNGILSFENSADSKNFELKHNSFDPEAGTNQLEINSTDTANIMVFNLDGKIGLGTANPSTLLNLESATSTAITAENTGNSAVALNLDANRSGADQGLGNINFKWNGTTVAQISGASGADTTNKDDGKIQFSTSTGGSSSVNMTLDKDGKLGIGISPVFNSLHIHKSNSDYNYLHITNTTTGTTHDDGLLFGFESDENAYIVNRENTALNFFTNNTQRMQISAGGNVGIGVVPEATNSLASSLQLGGNAYWLSTKAQGASGETDFGHNFYWAADGNYKYISTDEATQFRQGSGNFAFRTAPSGTADSAITFTERMRITQAGRVGIGTSANVDAKLHIEETASSTDVAVKIEATNDIYLQLAPANTTKWAITADYPSTDDFNVYNYPNNRNDFTIAGSTGKITTSSSMAVGGTLGVGGNQSTALHVINTNPIFRLQNGGNYFDYAHTSGNDIDISYNGGSSLLHLQNDGNVGINTNSPTAFLTGSNKVLQVDGEVVITGTNSSKLVLGEAGNSLSYVWQHANLPMLFGTNNTERMRISADGAVNITGTLTAGSGSKITSSSADTTFTVETTSGTTIFPIIDLVSSHSSVGGKIRQGGTDVISLDKSQNATFGGNIEILKGTPTLILKQTDASSNQIEMKNSSGSIVGRIKYDTAGGNHMYIENRNAGNLVLETADVARMILDDNSRISLSNNDSGGSTGTNSTTGNSIFGYNSGNSIQSGGVNNSFYGHGSGTSVTTGDANVFLGDSTGSSVSTGSFNTYIGKNADGAGTRSNSSALGYNTVAQSDNSVTLGNASVTDVYMSQDSQAYVHAQNSLNHVANSMSQPYYKFDGVNDAITVGNVSSTMDKIYSASVFFYIEDAIVADTSGGNGALFTGSGADDDMLWIGALTGSISQEIILVGNSSNATVYQASSLSAGHHHIAISWDGTQYDIYLDGKQVTTTNIGTPALLDSDDLIIGNGDDDSDGYGSFNGQIHSLSLWNKSLTATEIKELYSGMAVPFKYKGANQTGLTSGTLVKGKAYRITTYNSNDDFTNLGASSNATGVEFVSTGATPTEWLHSSVLVPIGAVAEYGGSDAGEKIWGDKSGNGLHGTVSGATLENTPYGSSTEYEEGTFDITLSCSGGIGIAMDGSFNLGRYIKIGNKVTVQGQCKISAVGDVLSGNLKINGLPYTITDTGDASDTSAVALHCSALASSLHTVVGIGNVGATTIELQEFTGTTTQNCAEHFQQNSIITFSFTYMT